MPRANFSGVLFLGFLFALSGCGQAPPPSESVSTSVVSSINVPIPEKPYLERLTTFKTRLTRHGPAPQQFQNTKPPRGVQAITYPSGDLTLKAWVAFPKGASPTSKVPGVIYFHGGFAFGADDYKDATPFLNAGYAVMCPMLRGENGNPGNFEFYLGEVDDAKAAVAWFAAQDNIDAGHLYTFGHSAGGVVSALLSLHETAIRHGGSSGGLYGTSLFDVMADAVPFNAADPVERQMRVLISNAKWMKRAHYGYVGMQDTLQEVAAAQSEITKGQTQLKVVTLPGDHYTSLNPAALAYIKVLKENP